MKRIIFVASALFLMSMQIMAQKFFDVYQNGKAAASIPTTSIDSIGLTGMNMQDRKVNFYRNDKIVNSFPVNTVDSIKIFRPDDEQLVYLGIIGFNQNLYEKSLDVLAQSTSGLYTKYVDGLECKDGTLLYYAVDQALNSLFYMNFPTSLSNVFLITFTDGLDQGSLMMNGYYYSDEQYLNAVKNRICNTRVKGLPVTAYSLGLRGNDVSDYTMFQNNLKKLASSEDNAFEVKSMNDVSTCLQEISNKIISISNRQTFSFKIPGRSSGTLVRFTFDGYSAENSKMYIEGTFNLADRSLTNVTYHGLKATSGSFIQGTQDGIFVNFTFTGMQREDGDGLISQSYICEYYKTAGSSSWQKNSEFSPSNNTQTTVTHSGAAIMLVLDCSNSLGSQFSSMKEYVQNFINNVANNTSDFKLEVPKNVTATLTDNLDVALSWDAVKHAECYDILHSNESYNFFSRVVSNLTSTSYTHFNALSGNNYYKIVVHGHGLESESTGTASIYRRIEEPNNVTATLTDDLDVVISWDTVKGAEYYKVLRSSTQNGTYSTVTGKVSSTLWTDKSPLSGNNYYKIIACGHGLVSAQSSYVFVNRKLDAPSNVTVTLIDNFDVKISWDAVKHAEYYKVLRGSTQNGTYSTVTDNVSSTLWTDKSPLNGNNYYKVIACGHGLESAQSSYVYVNRKLDAPSNVTATLTDDLDIVISWDTVKGAEYYKVLRSSTQNGTYSTVTDNVSSTLWTDDCPLGGDNYYKVIACGYGLESMSSTAIYIYITSCPNLNHPHMIDLGLPSGTKWACCNVGAQKPEDYGGYYAWGETSEKNTYNLSTYIHCDGSSATFHNIGKDIAGTQYDAATANWGSPWMMPTKEQMKELVNNCTSEWTTQNGVKGKKFTGPNGASIFLPAAGYRLNDDLNYAGAGYYWSSTLSESNKGYACDLYVISGYVGAVIDYRYNGQSVRPVRKN